MTNKINKTLDSDTCKEYEQLHFVFVKRLGAVILCCIALLWWLGGEQMKEYYKKGAGMYALYQHKGNWRESASVTNNDLLNERKFELDTNGYYYKIQQRLTKVNNMSHYKEELEQWGRERSAIYEEEKMAEAFKNAPVIDCTQDSRSIKELIEENARLHMELAKMRSWKEKVMNLISEKV